MYTVCTQHILVMRNLKSVFPLRQRRTCSTVSVEVKKTQHKYVVGPRAHVLHEILQTSGVWVEVPPSESDSNTITLRGPQDKLGQALTLVG